MRFSKVLFAVAIAGMFAACSGEKGRSVEKAEGLSFDSIVVDTIAHITADTMSPKVEVHLSIIFADGDKSEYVNDSIVMPILLSTYFMPQGDSVKSVPQAVSMFVDNFISSYKEDLSELYANDAEHRLFYDAEYECKTQVLNEKKGIVNYIAKINQYMGGPHGSYATLAYNIDMKTGKRLTLDDVFVPGYKPELTDIIVKKICKEFGARTVDELTREHGILADTEPYPTENFILKEDGLEFIYVCYEIAPYAVGEIWIEVSNSEIKNLLKK